MTVKHTFKKCCLAIAISATISTSPFVVAGSIDSVYQDLLGRSADFAGKDYWKKQLESGMSMADVRSAIKNSDEYKKKQNNQASRPKGEATATENKTGNSASHSNSGNRSKHPLASRSPGNYNQGMDNTSKVSKQLADMGYTNEDIEKMVDKSISPNALRIALGKSAHQDLKEAIQNEKERRNNRTIEEWQRHDMRLAQDGSADTEALKKAWDVYHKLGDKKKYFSDIELSAMPRTTQQEQMRWINHLRARGEKNNELGVSNDDYIHITSRLMEEVIGGKPFTEIEAGRMGYSTQQIAKIKSHMMSKDKRLAGFFNKPEENNGSSAPGPGSTDQADASTNEQKRPYQIQPPSMYGTKLLEVTRGQILPYKGAQNNYKSSLVQRAAISCFYNVEEQSKISHKDLPEGTLITGFNGARNITYISSERIHNRNTPEATFVKHSTNVLNIGISRLDMKGAGMHMQGVIRASSQGFNENDWYTFHCNKKYIDSSARSAVHELRGIMTYPNLSQQ